MSGVATGFEKLDKITSGWQPSDLIYRGKTGDGENCICIIYGT
jgi:replicative DNA helicase